MGREVIRKHLLSLVLWCKVGVYMAELGWIWPKPKPEPHKVLWVGSCKITTRYNIRPGWVNPLISGLDWVG
jgi:hypothetical protein